MRACTRVPQAAIPAALGVLAALVAPAACTAPDRPAGRAPELPPAARDFLAPDSARGLRLGEGVFYHFAWSARGPWAVHLVSADLARCELGLQVVPALEDDGTTRTRRTVTDMVPRELGRPLAGVNGDFFILQGGAPVGPEVTAGTRRFALRPAVAWGASRVPWIGDPVRVEDRGPEVNRMGFGPDTVGLEGRDDDVAPAGLQVIGGYPVLLDGGVHMGDLGVAGNPSFAAARHPRTAVGFDGGGKLFWLVVVDGRQPPRSAGMSLPELADLLIALGAEDALNLDGGGSSAMSLRGRIVNRPSDARGERTVANSLWLVRDRRGCGGLLRGARERTAALVSPVPPQRQPDVATAARPRLEIPPTEGVHHD